MSSHAFVNCVSSSPPAMPSSTAGIPNPTHSTASRARSSASRTSPGSHLILELVPQQLLELAERFNCLQSELGFNVPSANDGGTATAIMAVGTAETARGTDDNTSSRAERTTTRMIGKRARDGSLSVLVGSLLLVWAIVRSRKHRGRAAPLVLASAIAFVVGVRQRRHRRREDRIETGADVRRDEEGEKKVSDEAHVEAKGDLGANRNADESQSVYQSETEPNPRGVSDMSDVQTDDGGRFDFVEGKEPGSHRETHLEDQGAQDTRLHPEGDDEATEVDLSEAAMADEASEAAGPHPEQAYPAREGTDPEPTSPRAPERSGEGAAAPAGPSAEEGETDADDHEGEDRPAEGRTESDEG